MGTKRLGGLLLARGDFVAEARQSLAYGRIGERLQDGTRQHQQCFQNDSHSRADILQVGSVGQSSPESQLLQNAHITYRHDVSSDVQAERRSKRCASLTA